MTLLQQMNEKRLRESEELRMEVRERLASVLGRYLPGRKVVLFGSITKPGKFGMDSDIDLALEEELQGISVYQLTSLLAEEMGRSVDIVILPECRFRDRINREGELWTLPDCKS